MTEQEMWWDAYLQAMHRAPDAQTHDGRKEWCIVAADKALDAYYARWPGSNLEQVLAEAMKAHEESNADLCAFSAEKEERLEPFDTETEEEATLAIRRTLCKELGRLARGRKARPRCFDNICMSLARALREGIGEPCSQPKR